jgi:uncharacterized protein YdaU (DUF1376 family)
MSGAAPAIPLFGDAYIADTRHLSLEEHGAYLSLIMIAWRAEDCSLPDDDARLARVLGITTKKWAKLKPDVMAFWALDDGRWTQKRLTKERLFVAKKSKQNAESANARWNAKSLETNDASDANASPTQCERNAPPPSLSKKEESKKVTASSDAALAFSGSVIRLTDMDLKRWAKAYDLLDVPALLQSRDDWLANDADERTRKRWFISTSNHLASLQQKARALEREPDGYGMMA